MTIRPELYDQQAENYQRLVQYEDYEGNLLRELRALHPLAGARVVDLGAGTGRVTRLLMPHTARIHAFELSYGMLAMAARVGFDRTATNAAVTLTQADSRALPLPDGCADLAIEGWSFAQIKAWNRANWQTEVARAINEMLRVLRPDGTMILIETLGTGQTQPQPPAEWFTVLYDWFVREYGFAHSWLRTDFRIPSHAEAAHLMSFFFKEASPAIMASAEVAPDGTCIVPECTGIWWREKS